MTTESITARVQGSQKGDAVHFGFCTSAWAERESPGQVYDSPTLFSQSTPCLQEMSYSCTWWLFCFAKGWCPQVGPVLSMPCLQLADVCNRLDSFSAAGALNGFAKHNLAVGSFALAGLRMTFAVLTTIQ